MSHHTNIKICLSITLALSFQSYAQAQQASMSQSSQTTSVVGQPQVLDSYMKPTVVRTRESTDADGNVEKTVEPIVQERHEQVMIPTLDTTTTDTRSAAATAVKTETKQVATSTARPCAVKKISHHPRHHRYYTAHRTAPAAVASAVTTTASHVTTIQPTTVEHQERTTEHQTIMERRDPALDNN